MRIYTFIHSIVGAAAMWMIRQHKGRGCTPRNFDVIIKSLHERLLTSETFKKNEVARHMFYLANADHLRRFLSTTLRTIPEFLELNLREVEYNIGLRAKDVEDSEHRMERLNAARIRMGSFRYDCHSQLKPEYEFIDLDALVRNILNTIMSEQEDAEIKSISSN